MLKIDRHSFKNKVNLVNKIVYKPRTKLSKIEEVINPDKETGVSDYVTIEEITNVVGFPVSGNGSYFFDKNKGLGKKYILEKVYSGDGGYHLHAVRTVGFRKELLKKPSNDVVKEIRSRRCAICSTGTNITLDHKNPRKKQSLKLEDYQALCRHCNSTKREQCKRCINTGIRFDAKVLGYTISWFKGSKYYDPNLGCDGCYFHDPILFNSKLTLK